MAMVFVILAGAMAQAQEASVPPLVNYQGMLTDADGKPLTGTKKIEFNLYDAATGGTKFWGPQIFSSVPLVNGMFNVILGEKDEEKRLITDAFESSGRYLGIKVNDGDELFPRQQILSTPYAIRAEKAGKILQVVHNQTNEFKTSDQAIPWDDTIPQQTEGVEVLTVAITPGDSSNLLLVEAAVHATEDNNTANRLMLALFENSESDAIATAVGDTNVVRDSLQTIPFKHIMTAGTTSEITFKLRAGLEAGIININGGYLGRKLGGTLYSTLTVTEIAK
ncbi:Uncharacterized protein dnm_067000 [Desulfonema magnum]|uniref:Uncharacterized protein n=1 Tax=Desulfonema magnum TaxID=45655 RepID=A0A975BSZ3_9BACT|nr:Uncharacterized protein dnm_067000 [Desulfonema magnum]